MLSFNHSFTRKTKSGSGFTDFTRSAHSFCSVVHISRFKLLYLNMQFFLQHVPLCPGFSWRSKQSLFCLQRLQLSFNGIDLYFKYTQLVPVNNSDGLTAVAVESRTENIPHFLMEEVGMASVWAAHSGWLYSSWTCLFLRSENVVIFGPVWFLCSLVIANCSQNLTHNNVVFSFTTKVHHKTIASSRLSVVNNSSCVVTRPVFVSRTSVKHDLHLCSYSTGFLLIYLTGIYEFKKPDLW